MPPVPVAGAYVRKLFIDKLGLAMRKELDRK